MCLWHLITPGKSDISGQYRKTLARVPVYDLIGAVNPLSFLKHWQMCDVRDESGRRTSTHHQTRESLRDC